MIDHRRLGRELHLFDTHELVGAGLPLWLPDGAVIRAELERFAAEQAVAAGCQRVFSPVLAKRELYERSGHWAKFADDMFPVMNVGGEEFVLRPANCPHHVLIYAAEQRSYRDLPIRLNELGSMFRSELSGVLGGLARVRQISLDDTHVFCRADQVESEVAAAIAQIHASYALLGLDVAYYRLSLSGPKGKYIGNPALWKGAEKELANVLDELGLPYKEAVDEAAFYGPKIDVQVVDPAGREETLSTVQLDFNLPDRFDLSYVGASGERLRPVMIHRGLLSAMERLVAHLIEVYAGAFPVWLSPVQVIALPVGAGQSKVAAEFVDRLRAAGLRADIDDSDNTLGLRIRRAVDRKAPYIAVLGEREVAAGSVTIRQRGGKQLGPRPQDEVVGAIAAVAASRSKELAMP